MASEWGKIPLGDLVALQRGHDLPSQDRRKGEIPIMGSSGLTGYHDEAKCKGPGIVIGRSGNSMGVVSYSDSDFWPLNTALYVTDFKGNDERYIYYLLSQIDFDQFNSGSAQKSLNRNAVYPFLVWATKNKDEQKKIGVALERYENKIHLNRQTNQTLEQMAQALFKSWFVDFDPVIDNALAAGKPIPDALQARAQRRQQQLAKPDHKPLPEAIRQHFPCEFEQTEALGWVPKGWGINSLAEITTELRRGISPKYTEEEGTVVLNQKCIRNHEVNFELSRRNDPSLRKTIGRELKIGDMLINSTGVGTLGRMAQVKYLPETTVVDSHVTVVRPREDVYPIFAFGQMMLSLESYVESLGEGSTGQTELSRKILSEQKILVPGKEALAVIDKKLEHFSYKAVSLSKESQVLARLRDTLLPKLISGELRIPDLETEVSDAVA
ncbi:restriction endonuclease subunit S [Microbulbifer sp. A4B17]|uniref:restriction endonuclease subunit S n=1 Tax=Microbulbifer sp. A4B17 TaxID=359370 RepID=UPI000D52E18D|nr:restriction endonuclease subunit S [Microbulbifer sp. A4B17]AWF82648.1 restriction endonuclease subunit S [Microbulbifer sp. A4B17]